MVTQSVPRSQTNSFISRLRLSKFHSTLATTIALKWPSITARILIRKLNLLYKVSSGGESIGCHIYSSLSITDPQSLRLIQECLSLEEKIGCHGVTDIVLDNNGDSGCIQGVKKLILEDDWDACLRETSQRQST